MLSKKNLLAALTLIAVFLLLKYDKAAAESALTALSSCVRQVIPSLFPYMVLSSFILTLDLARPLYKYIPMSAFALPSCAAPVLFMGLLCGFPVGAAGCASLCENGLITKEEASRLCAISSHTSPAFLIGTVGALWGRKSFGVFLYTVGVFYALTSALIMRKTAVNTRSYANRISPAPQPKAVSAFCQSVTDAASSCLAVTGFIVFFRVAAGVASEVMPPLSDVFMTIFEFSSGAVNGASVGGIAGAAMTGFAVGFSGISVLMQIMRYLDQCGISAKPIFVSKIIEGSVCSLCSVVYYIVSPMQPSADALSSSVSLSYTAVLLPIFLLVLLSFAGHFLLPRNYFPHRS